MRRALQRLIRGVMMAADKQETLRPTSDFRDPGTDRTPPPPAARGTAPAGLPESFGRYRILRKLGQGGMGAVYLAEDPRLERRVALKVPLLGTANPDTLARFYREARAAATIDHPNVCPVYDVGEFNGVHYVTMAYIEGRPLSELLRDGKPLPQRPTAAVVRKLAVALQEAHARGVIHRDLKPANIVINRRKEPVVMDFGLARRANQDEQLTRDGTMLGTPAYMPPEQVRGDLEAMGPGCDVYSLGVILYQMLTGQLPFQGPVISVLAQILNQQPRPLSELRPDIDPPLEAICLKAMAKEVGDRYGSMAEFAAALTAYLRGESTSRRPEILELPPDTEPAAADRPSDDGKATELLGRLLERLEATAPPEPRSRSFLLPLIAGAVLLLVGIGVAVYILKPTPQQVGSSTTVVVQLQGLGDRINDPSVAKIYLDGREITRDELARPIHLEPGEHVLETKRADGTVIETYRFKVGRDDDNRPIHVAVEQPPSAPASRSGADLEPGKIAAKDIGNIAALESHFFVRGTKYDPTNRRVMLELEAKRLITYAASQLQFDVRLYDADDVRIHTDILRFERNEVKPGDSVQAQFPWTSAVGVKRVLLVPRGDKEFPTGPRPSVPPYNPASLPAGVAFDFRALEDGFAILTARHDADQNRMTLVLEAKRPIDYAATAYHLEARMSDAAGTHLRSYLFHFEQFADVLKGERVRAHFTWGGESAAGVAKVTLVKPK